MSVGLPFLKANIEDQKVKAILSLRPEWAIWDDIVVLKILAALTKEQSSIPSTKIGKGCEHWDNSEKGACTKSTKPNCIPQAHRIPKVIVWSLCVCHGSHTPTTHTQNKFLKYVFKILSRQNIKTLISQSIIYYYCVCAYTHVHTHTHTHTHTCTYRG